MKLRILNENLQQKPDGQWENIPQALCVDDFIARKNGVYSICGKTFLGDDFFRYRPDLQFIYGQYESFGLSLEIDDDLKDFIKGLIDQKFIPDLEFHKGFITCRRNDFKYLVGFFRTPESFYLLKNELNGLLPLGHLHYQSFHVFSPDYNSLTGLRKNVLDNPEPIDVDTATHYFDGNKWVEFCVPITPQIKEFQDSLIREGRAELKTPITYSKEQVRRIFDAGVEYALDPHHTHETCFNNGINELFEQALKKEHKQEVLQPAEQINPLTKKPFQYNIEIRLNRALNYLNFTTGRKSTIPSFKIIRFSMDPSEFLNTFLDWVYVASIRVTIDK